MIICKRSVDLDNYLHLFQLLFVIVCGWSMFGVGRWSLFFCCLLLFADPDDHLSLVVVCHCLSLVIVCLLSLSVVCRL